MSHLVSLPQCGRAVVASDLVTEHTPSGKIVKGELRKVAKQKWESRRRDGTGREPLANL